MARGLIGTVKLAVALAFAIPLAVFGLDRLLSGQLLIGGIAVAVALGMVLVEEYITTPGDIPETAAETAVGAIVDESGADESDRRSD